MIDPQDRHGKVHVFPAHNGVQAGRLVHEGELVDSGDPLACLSPEVSA